MKYKSMIDDIGLQILDQDAYTIPELVQITGKTKNQLYEISRHNQDTGKWEKVWKKEKSGRIVPAYRPRKK